MLQKCLTTTEVNEIIKQNISFSDIEFVCRELVQVIFLLAEIILSFTFDSGMTPEQVAKRMDVPMKFINACMR